MKSVLLYANQDAGLEARLQAALDIARLSKAISPAQVTPYNTSSWAIRSAAYHALPTVVEQVRRPPRSTPPDRGTDGRRGVA
jgi:hypothetical protein